ncbi:hypothetical protein [Arthrobacter mobilis]|uniref:Uncharacterized protein n=1 Tax=Arthrobacter mobilis TaxID=2724944 RepID=A0A7X6HDX7_9MICC|nr:hypothetical protein [Arthrobacter mobilis]NKX55333.1 hypothetical protein [Arthrobacter mobilis]
MQSHKPQAIGRRQVLGLFGGTALAGLLAGLNPPPAAAFSTGQAAVVPATLSARAKAEYATVMDATAGLRGGRCFIRRTSTYGWQLGYQVDRLRWAVYTLKAPTVPGPRQSYDRVPQLHTAYIRLARNRHRCTDRTRWKYPGTWSVQESHGFLRALPGAASAAYSLPAGSRSICLHTASHVANGLVRVSLVDGNGRQVALAGAKTGRQLLEDGTVTAAQIAAGAVSGSARYVDTYVAGSSSGSEHAQLLAEDLDPARRYTLKVWPVNVTLKGRINRYAAVYGASVETQRPDGKTTWITLERMGTAEATHSAHEYALNVDIGGRSLFIGGVHGYEALVSLAVYVDGKRRSLRTGQVATGRFVRIQRKTRLDHPGIPNNGKAADAWVSYSLGSHGLVVRRKVTWAVAGTYRRPYFVMWPTSLERVTWVGADQTWDANRSLGKSADALLGYQKSLTCVAWNPGSRHVGVCDYPEDAVAGWKWGTADKPQVYYEDRAAGLKKLYVCPLPPGRSRAFAGGSTFRAESKYRMGVVPDADSLLDRP